MLVCCPCARSQVIAEREAAAAALAAFLQREVDQRLGLARELQTEEDEWLARCQTSLARVRDAS